MPRGCLITSTANELRGSFVVEAALLMWVAVEVAIVGCSNEPPLQAVWLESSAQTSHPALSSKENGSTVEGMVSGPAPPIGWKARDPEVAE